MKIYKPLPLYILIESHFQRKVCAARASGIRVFRHANETTMTGCTTHPGHEKKCPLHREDDSPVLEFLPAALKQKMRIKRTRSKNSENDKAFPDNREDDEVFIVERILNRKQSQYLVQCTGYQPEWIEAEFIPSFLKEHYHETGNVCIPAPFLHSTIMSGNTALQSLSWRSDGTLPRWTPDNQNILTSEDEEDERASDSLKCNTKKNKASFIYKHHGHPCVRQAGGGGETGHVSAGCVAVQPLQ